MTHTRQQLPLTFDREGLIAADGTRLMLFARLPDKQGAGYVLPAFERGLLAEFLAEAANTYDATREELTTLRREVINTRSAMYSMKLPKGR